jgi:hypothetical protein
LGVVPKQGAIHTLTLVKQRFQQEVSRSAHQQAGQGEFQNIEKKFHIGCFASPSLKKGGKGNGPDEI